LAQDVFVRAGSCATSRQLAVDHDSRQAPDAVLLRAGGDSFLVHIVDLDFVVRTCDFPDHINSFLAGRTSRAEDFDFVFLGHNPFSSTIRARRSRSVGTMVPAGQASYSKPMQR
jgi:hypothetical protein